MRRKRPYFLPPSSPLLEAVYVHLRGASKPFPASAIRNMAHHTHPTGVVLYFERNDGLSLMGSGRFFILPRHEKEDWFW